MNASTAARLSAEAVIPLPTLDPAGPMEDLEWLDAVIGDARVVAIGESAHYNRESYLLRHRLLRYLVERHGFGAYAMETGFVEGWRADDWVHGGEDQLGHVLANGITGLMGLWTQMRAHLEWMRRHNHDAARPVGFYGIDLCGSNMSLPPGLDAVIAYLAEADPEFAVDASIQETASAFAAPSAFSLPAAMAAYGKLAFATDLRRLSPADATAVRAASQQRFGTYYAKTSPLDAYDVIVHLPHVTPAEPDHDALARSPHDVQEAFSHWKPR